MRISARYLEPLQDWVLLRNLLSISLRPGGTMRTMRSEAAENNLLVKSGFIKSERSTLSSKLAIDAPGYTIPVMFNPFYRNGNALINDATFDDESTWPLYRTIAESQSRHLGLTNVGCLKGCERIKFATGPQARSDLGRLVPVFTRPTEAKWLYMVIEDRGGASQLELANELINALDRLLYAPILSYTGNATASHSYRDIAALFHNITPSVNRVLANQPIIQQAADVTLRCPRRNTQIFRKRRRAYEAVPLAQHPCGFEGTLSTSSGRNGREGHGGFENVSILKHRRSAAVRQ